LKSQSILLLGLASLIFGCEGPLTSDEAGLLDAVAFVTGGQQEGTMPQGFETRWRRTVRGREIEYQSIGQNTGFGQANDPHRDSRYVRIGVTITSPQKCVFKTVVPTAYSKGTSKESFNAPSSEVTTLDFNKVYRLDIEEGDSLRVVIEGKAWMCNDGRCQDNIAIAISASRQEDLARVVKSKRHAIEFIKKACPGMPHAWNHPRHYRHPRPELSLMTNYSPDFDPRKRTPVHERQLNCARAARHISQHIVSYSDAV
jgi:hypothetical protein